MTLSFEIFDEAPTDWNNFLLKDKTGIIHNTKEYGLYAPYENYESKYFRVLDSTGNIKLQVILLESTKNDEKIKKILSRFTKKSGHLTRWNYGPTTESKDATEIFFKYLKQSKKKFYGLEHPLSTIQQNSCNIKKWATFLIDLSNSKEDIFSRIDKNSGRKNIERSQERGVEIEEISDNNLLEYLEIFNQTKKDRGEKETSVEVMGNFWRILKPIGLSGYLAKKDGKYIGGMLFSFFNGYINEWGVARSQQDFEEKLYSQDLIKWEIIQWGIKNKMRFYDLTGFNPNPINDKEIGILRYKKKWGGEVYDQKFIFN